MKALLMKICLLKVKLIHKKDDDQIEANKSDFDNKVFKIYFVIIFLANGFSDRCAFRNLILVCLFQLESLDIF